MENHAIVDVNNESTPPDFDWNAEKLVSSIEKLAVDFINDGTLAQPTFPSEIQDTLSEDDIALFLHTSGTTSRPKGVPLTHGNLMASLENIVNTYALNQDDLAMVVMPLFHVHGLIGVSLSAMKSGGSMVIPPRFSASNFWQIQADTNATWYSAVPTIHQILLMRADDDSAPNQSFRFIRSCSAALAPTVFSDLENRLGAPVLEAYGMTEASHQMSSNLLPPGPRTPG